MRLSIIIATKNRAAFLRETFEALRSLEIPPGLDAVLSVIDNASTDETAEVVRSARLPRLRVDYRCESTSGKCRALNHALAHTRGEMILFTDDDVRPPPDWIAGMTQPLIDHGPCAVAGGVVIAPHLSRAWMTPLHRSWLAATDWLDPQNPRGMVGANMAFSRDVLQRVPAFDVELGPGALGFGDEQLFAYQLLEAGYRIVGRTAVKVEHHFEPGRLLRSSWLQAARKRGRAQAYCGHHWAHWTSRYVRPRRALAAARLALYRLTHSANPDAEGCSERELTLEFQYALYCAHLRERQRPRNYSYRGLVSRAGAATSFAASPSFSSASR
mgnify:CR=1 FL=1